MLPQNIIQSPVPPTKPQLRSTLKATLAAVTPQSRALASEQLCTQIIALDLYQSAATILCYAALPTEISIDPLITHALKNDKAVCIPAINWDTKAMRPVQIRSLDNDLQIGRYGLRSPISECKPVPDAQISLALIPGLGFDPSGQRLGRGAGFYDRWIEQRLQCDDPIALVGVCFDEQLVERIPTDPHDQIMHQIVTPTTTLQSQ